MTIEKTTPYGCEIWHEEDLIIRIKKIIYQKDKLTYCIDSDYNIRCSDELSFNRAYSLAIKNRAFFEYDKISNKDLQYMSDILYKKATDMVESNNHRYANESARNIYNDIMKCMQIHNFIKPTINFATLTTIENIINKANDHIAKNGFVALDIRRMISDELHKEYYKLNNEMQEKIKPIIHKSKHTYWDLDNIIENIKKMGDD